MNENEPYEEPTGFRSTQSFKFIIVIGVIVVGGAIMVAALSGEGDALSFKRSAAIPEVTVEAEPSATEPVATPTPSASPTPEPVVYPAVELSANTGDDFLLVDLASPGEVLDYAIVAGQDLVEVIVFADGLERKERLGSRAGFGGVPLTAKAPGVAEVYVTARSPRDTVTTLYRVTITDPKAKN